MVKRWGVHLPGLSSDNAGVAADPPARRRTGPAVVGFSLYHDGVLEDVPADGNIAELYAQTELTPGAFLWLGLHEPDEHELTEIAAVFGLHPLAVEDVLHHE